MMEQQGAGVGRLQVTSLGRVHLAVDGRTLCGRVSVDERDVYGEESGLRVWNDGPLGRCGQCSAALAARIRRPAPRREDRAPSGGADDGRSGADDASPGTGGRPW
jgi:hypothetical protein